MTFNTRLSVTECPVIWLNNLKFNDRKSFSFFHLKYLFCRQSSAPWNLPFCGGCNNPFLPSSLPHPLPAAPLEIQTGHLDGTTGKS
jgi:hypothetical protein